MIAATLIGLFVVVSFATLLTLTDVWVRGRFAYGVLKSERALAKAGFLPIVEAEELRLRPAPRTALAATRPYARQVPSRARAVA